MQKGDIIKVNKGTSLKKEFKIYFVYFIYFWLHCNVLVGL